MKRVIFLTFLTIKILLLTIPLGEAEIKLVKRGISIEEAIKKGIVSANFVSKKGHQDLCMVLKIKNLLPKDTNIRIEAGRILISEDTTKQDILIVKEYLLTLAANQEKTIDLTGYCCRANRHSPVQKTKFNVGKMADSNVIKLARYLNTHSFNATEIQNAVWCLSDNHSLAGIHNDDPNQVIELKKFISRLKGIEIPWYTIIYKQDTGVVFSGKHLTVKGNIKYYINKNTYVSMVILNSRGVIVDKLFTGKLMLPDTYNDYIDVKVANWPKGKYTVRVIEGGKTLAEKVFEL